MSSPEDTKNQDSGWGQMGGGDVFNSVWNI